MRPRRRAARETDAPPGEQERGEAKAGTDAPRAGEGRGGSPSPSSSGGSSSVAQQRKEALKSDQQTSRGQPVRKKPKSSCSTGGVECDTSVAPPLPVASWSYFPCRLPSFLQSPQLALGWSGPRSFRNPSPLDEPASPFSFSSNPTEAWKSGPVPFTAALPSLRW